MSSVTKQNEATFKQLVRMFGVRESHRILADRMTWERFARRGETPVYTPRPKRLAV